METEPTEDPTNEPEGPVDQGEVVPFSAGERPGLEKTRPSSVSEAHLKTVLESLVFVSDRPIAPAQLARLARAKVAVVRKILEELAGEYKGRGVELLEVGGGYQFRTAAANAPFVRDLVAARPVRLTRAQLEALAIVAYRQPITRPEIDDIRGVDSGSALKVLLERGLLKILGKKEEPGRPLLYGTTQAFLEFFGMSTLRDLPTLREFTDLSDESRALFERRMGESLAEDGAAAEARAVAASEEEEAEAIDDAELERIANEQTSDEDG